MIDAWRPHPAWWALAVVILCIFAWAVGRCSIGSPYRAPALDGVSSERTHESDRDALERARHRAQEEHHEAIEEMEQELIKVRADRARLQQLLDELQRLALIVMTSLVLAFSYTSPARADDALSHAVIVDGKLCVPASLGHSLLSAYQDAPRLELQLKALRTDRALAQREITLMEQMREQTQLRLDEAILRERSWEHIAQAMASELKSLEHNLQRTNKRRMVWLGVSTAVLGGTILAVAASR